MPIRASKIVQKFGSIEYVRSHTNAEDNVETDPLWMIVRAVKDSVADKKELGEVSLRLSKSN